MAEKRWLPWSRPVLWGNEVKFAADAVQSTYWSGGEYLSALERRFGEYHHVPPSRCLAVNNGTASLHLAYMALGIGPGDEIILPGFAFAAAANMALLVGATPVFVDVDPETWLMTPDTVERAVTSRTRAVVLVHTYGAVCDVKEVARRLAGSGIVIIEDCAESPFSKVDGDICGSIGDVASWSLQSTKTISCGEGGLVVAKDEALCARMRLIRSHGMLPERKYHHFEVGHNFRLTNIQAAVAVAQLDNIDRILDWRRSVWGRYQKVLAGLPLVMQKVPANNDAVMWGLGVILTDSRLSREQVMARLADLGIETRPGFESATQQPHFHASNLPESDRIAQNLFSLPFPSDLSDDELEHVTESLTRVLSLSRV